MATTKRNSKKNKLTQEKMMDLYIEDVLELERTPKSIYKFCKTHKFEESEFYNCFGSFKALQREIWVRFFDYTLTVMEKSDEYKQYGTREKLLTFYYTFFEVLTANRSFALFMLKEQEQPLKNLGRLSGLRKRIKNYAENLIAEENAATAKNRMKHSATVFSEAAWFQFLFLLKFWMDDTSPKFEKTDIAIEKSVNTGFDVFDYAPLERIMDFGKFMWKEKMP